MGPCLWLCGSHVSCVKAENREKERYMMAEGGDAELTCLGRLGVGGGGSFCGRRGVDKEGFGQEPCFPDVT